MSAPRAPRDHPRSDAPRDPASRNSAGVVREAEGRQAGRRDERAAPRCLIVNADDFGQASGINRGVIEAHERGIVTSASMMVRWSAAAEAAAYAHARPTLSLGLHVDFGEWAFRDDTWVPVYQVASTDDAEVVASEVESQLAAFRRLVGRDPTHLDSHQHAHRHEPVRSIFVELARQLGVPLRECSSAVRYSGAFYGQTGKGEPYPRAITVDALIDIVESLRPGTTELGCHPGLGDDLDTMYRDERLQEVRSLCDPRVRAAIVRGGVQLRSFTSP